MFDFLSRPFDNRQTTRIILLAIILFTLPCYCLGAALLAYAPADSEPTANPANATLGGATLRPALTASFTPFANRTPTVTGGPLGPTPIQVFPRATNTPFLFATWTPFATWTTAPTLTAAPSLTIAPSPTLIPTLVPTNTLPPTSTPPPTNTEPPPPPTDEPPPTAEPPTDEPPPTQETMS